MQSPPATGSLTPAFPSCSPEGSGNRRWKGAPPPSVGGAGLLGGGAAGMVQRLAHRRVAPIDVGISDDVAVAGRRRGEIGDIDRHRMGERGLLVAAGLD